MLHSQVVLVSSGANEGVVQSLAVKAGEDVSESRCEAQAEIADKKYTWAQTDFDVTISMPIESSIKGKDIIFNFTGVSLALGIKGQDLVIDGELLNLAKPDESTWEIETADGQRIVKAVLVKAQPYRNWECILKKEVQGKADGDEESLIKAMLKEWPKLHELEPEDQKAMAIIRPQYEVLSPETPRSELFRLIKEINDIARKYGDDKKACSPTLFLHLS